MIDDGIVQHTESLVYKDESLEILPISTTDSMSYWEDFCSDLIRFRCEELVDSIVGLPLAYRYRATIRPGCGYLYLIAGLEPYPGCFASGCFVVMLLSAGSSRSDHPRAASDADSELLSNLTYLPFPLSTS